jgi:hypothetical protein
MELGWKNMLEIRIYMFCSVLFAILRTILTLMLICRRACHATCAICNYKQLPLSLTESY